MKKAARTKPPPAAQPATAVRIEVPFTEAEWRRLLDVSYTLGEGPISVIKRAVAFIAADMAEES